MPTGVLNVNGGEGGIRTLDTLPYTHFPGVLLQPLGHLTNGQPELPEKERKCTQVPGVTQAVFTRLITT